MKHRGRLSIPSHHNRKATQNVVALRRAATVAAYEQRGLLRPGIIAHDVVDDLARYGGQLIISRALSSDRDPDTDHRARLTGYQNTIGKLLEVLDLPRQARYGLRAMLMDINDLINGRSSEILTPVQKGPGRQPDPLRDWFARAALAILAERTKRLQTAPQSDRAAYVELLGRIERDLRPFKLSVADVLPGRKAAKPYKNQERLAEVSERDQMLEEVAKRCERHKYDLDGGSDTVPKVALIYFQRDLADLDQIEGAGALTPVTDDEIWNISVELRMSWDRADHERKLLNAQETRA